MSLLHATWLQEIEGEETSYPKPILLLWADQWVATEPKALSALPVKHPFTLSINDLGNWLQKEELYPSKSFPQKALLTLPSKRIQSKTIDSMSECILPLQAGEPTPKKYEWWPWEIEGLALDPYEAITWLSKLPLSNKSLHYGEDLLWWSHLERWVLSLIAKGLWLPKVEVNKYNDSLIQAKWIPLISNENERKRLEEFSTRLPRVATCGVVLKDNNKKNSKKNFLSSTYPKSNSIFVVQLLEELIDAHLREDFCPNLDSIDPLLQAWLEALTSSKKEIYLNSEDLNRLIQASANWKERISGKIQAAKLCLELCTPEKEEDTWKLNFSLQAEADPNLRVSASTVWSNDSEIVQLGDLRIKNAEEILLEGLGRALAIFPILEKGLECATPDSMKLEPAEVFLFLQTIAKQLRKIGIGVILPQSLSGGLASRLGIAIKAELSPSSKQIVLGQKLNWEWELMIGGARLTVKELEILTKRNSPLVHHKNTWIQLRPSDLKNAEKFYGSNPSLSLDDALSLSATDGNTLMGLPIHHFEVGPNLQDILEKHRKQKSPEPIAAPNNFIGQLRPYQERGLGWLKFLYRFGQGGCLADDMGLGKTIQMLAFIQHLKEEQELHQVILIIAPTSLLTNWTREALKFTPELSILEHYGSKRSTTTNKLQKHLQNIDVMITSYGLLLRDLELLKTITWQGIIIDEAQAIKNPNAKQSQAIHELKKTNIKNSFRFALTGTPVENKVSEIWSMMHFLNPKVLGESDFFQQRYKLPIERYGDISSLNDLKSRVNPYILRRLKTDKSIIADLPKKIEHNEWVHLSNEQRALYNKIVDKTLNEISTAPLGQKNGKFLSLLIRLKQICNHPALFLKEDNITKDFSSRSGKIQRLEEILEEILEANDRALIFTQFTEWGYLLQSYFQKKWQVEIPFLHGSVKKINRQRLVDQFQEDPRGPQLFLLSLKAGGIGLNLTRANHVLHIDRWWNPAVENQATDRAYRIGQSKTVMVHKFITTGSLEEKINQMIIKKSQLAEEVIGSGEEWLGSLEINEIRQLVALENNE